MIKIILAAIIVFCLMAGNVAGITTIPAGSVSSYNMNTANETYVLEGDITGTGTALLGGANGVKLNGMGHIVNFGTKTTGYGISITGKHNIEITNVTFLQTNSSVSNCYGIYVYGGNNTNIHSITSNVTKSYAVYFRGEHDGRLTDSNVISLTGTPMYFNLDYNTTVSGNTIYAGSGYGSIVESSYDIDILDNTITAPLNIGISVPTTSHHINIADNIITSGNNVGVRLINSNNNTVRDNTISSPSNSGVYLGGTLGSDYNIVDGNTVTSTSGIAAYFINSTNNQITDNNCTSVSANGIYVRASSNNVIRDNIGRSTNDHGLNIAYGSNYNDLDNNVGISTNKKGIFLFNVTGNVFDGTLVSSPYCSYPATRSIGMFGDSITEGGQGGTVYGQLGEMIEANVSAATGMTWTVQNRGFSGERAYRGRERFTQELDIFDPDIAMIMYGTNDLLDSRPQQAIIDDVLWMAGQAEARGIRTYVLLTPAMYQNNNLRIWLDQNLSTQATAAGYDVINVYDAIDTSPRNGAFDAYNSTVYSDGIHPNSMGNSMITRYIVYNSSIDISDPVVYPPEPDPDDASNAGIVSMLYVVLGLVSLIPVGLVGASLLQIMTDGATDIRIEVIGGVTIAVCVIDIILYSFTVIL